MNYTINQLRIFLAVVKNQSITKAAEELHMTQPALSIQLKNFQQQFEVPLTEIIGKKLYVTDFGYSIRELADNVMKDLDLIKYKTKEYKGLLTGNLKISSASTGKYILPYFLKEFSLKHTGVDLKIDVSNKSSVVENLKNNQVDFALISVMPDELELEQEILITNHLHLIGDQKDFGPYRPLILREKGSATRKAMDNYFKRSSNRKTIELTSTEAVKQALIAGLGYSILPILAIQNELKNKDLFIIDQKGLPIINSWRLVWRKDKKLSPVANEYLNFLRSSKEVIIKSKFKWYSKFT